MGEINLLLKLKNLLGTVINPRQEDGHGSAAGTPTFVQSINPTADPETGLNKEATQLLVKAKTDNLDITLSALRDALKGGKTLADIWSSLQTQREISTSLWTDDSGAKYVRRDVVDESAGTITVSFTDELGNVATPGAGLRPLASTDKETVESLFTATAGGTGYSAGDILARVLVIDTSVTPPGISSTWMNVTAGTIIAAPTAGTIDQFVGLTDAELALRINTLGRKASAASTPVVLSDEQEAVLSARASEATLQSKFGPATHITRAQRISTIGVNNIIVPAAGNRIELSWLGLSCPDANTAEVLVTVAFESGATLYRWNIPAGSGFVRTKLLGVLDGSAADKKFQITLSAAQPVDVNYSYTEVTP